MAERLLERAGELEDSCATDDRLGRPVSVLVRVSPVAMLTDVCTQWHLGKGLV